MTAGGDRLFAGRVPIRAFRPGDALAMAANHAAVHRRAAPDCTAEQRHAWSPASGDPARTADGRMTLVATGARGEVAAHADQERDGHIDRLYHCPDHPGSAGPLDAGLEQAARSRHIPSLRVEASEPARRFLAKRGSVRDCRRDVVIAGVPMHDRAMTKPLDRA